MTQENKFLNEDTKSQEAEILAWLQTGKPITPEDAIKKMKNTCYRLGARIFNLKEQGHNIRTEMVQHINKVTGAKKRFARYWLNKPGELFDK